MIKPSKDKSFGYVIIFALMFAFVIARAIFMEKPASNNAITNGAEKQPSLIARAEKQAPRNMNFSEILIASNAQEIATANIRGNIVTGALRDGTEFKSVIEHDPALLSRIADSGAAVTIDDSRGWADILGTWVPILMGVIFIWWIFRGFKGGAGIGRAATAYNPTKITTGKTKTTFADVAGIDSEKQEVSEIVDFLKNPDKFKKLGARVPRGILLSGEPGTGKTLLARAIAGEANVPFFAASGSDFSGIIVGLGVAKIKEIFDMAKRSAPCILFIDEIDAIGMHRGRSSFNDNDREQTLNQLLIEMDGFSNDSGIIVIGATNRPDMLDKALLRPGRFDRQVYIELPNLQGREEILELYSKKMKLAKSVGLKNVARGTTGFSGADLENLLNEAALVAARLGHKEIENSDLEEARDKTLMGPKKNKKMRDWDKRLTAYHEAGHAFISVHYADLVDPIHKATIIPRGRSLGMTQFLPTDDKVSLTISEIKANMSVAMGGRAAEEVFLGADKITTGAEMDIAHATYLARRSITMDGLSEKIGPVAINQADTFGTRHALESASQKTAELVDSEIRSWMDTAHRDAKNILGKNREKVKKLAEELLARETLSREEIEKIIIGKKMKKKN
ncbi:MAG: ATP-dependent zinc metalloprotease FtsH [Rickettsiales bacterium]|jgi:cell division protease FtsH|nr:ATP-dependent zinc metalloprotease FtsH [Rickettsiales bacterium]